MALTDWRGDRPLLNFGYGDRYVQPVGLLNQAREKRVAYEVVRVLYNDERLTAISAGNYRMTFPWVHVLVGLLVIILIGYQSMNRRFAESLQRALIRSYNFFRRFTGSAYSLSRPYIYPFRCHFSDSCSSVCQYYVPLSCR